MEITLHNFGMFCWILLDVYGRWAVLCSVSHKIVFSPYVSRTRRRKRGCISRSLIVGSRRLVWEVWNRIPWYWDGLTAGDNQKTKKLGKSSCKPSETWLLRVWLCWCRKALTSSPRRPRRWWATSTFGGSCTTEAYSCCCLSCWSNTELGRTARCAYLRWPKWRTIRYRWKRIWKCSCIICVSKLKSKLWRW